MKTGIGNRTVGLLLAVAAVCLPWSAVEAGLMWDVTANPVVADWDLKAETGDFFTTAELRFERAPTETSAKVKEDSALYEVRPAKKRLE